MGYGYKCATFVAWRSSGVAGNFATTWPVCCDGSRRASGWWYSPRESLSRRWCPFGAHARRWLPREELARRLALVRADPGCARIWRAWRGRRRMISARSRERSRRSGGVCSTRASSSLARGSCRWTSSCCRRARGLGRHGRGAARRRARRLGSRHSRPAAGDVGVVADIEVLLVDEAVAASWALLRVHLADGATAPQRQRPLDRRHRLRARIPVVTQDEDFGPVEGVGGLQIVRV